MKAAYFTEYGSTDQLKIIDVPRPQPAENEVLIKNHASSINFGNLGHIKCEPFLIRAVTGFGKPKFKIPGGDIAGVIETVGTQVTEYKPGDKVMADSACSGFGAFAEYVSVPQIAVVHKPENLSFNETATLPLAASVALSGLRGVKKGQEVLLVGSTGSVGSFAVQIAKAFGAEVTAVCNGKKADYVNKLGADHILDYTKEDFTKQDKKYDYVAGIAGTRTMSEYKSVLKQTGTYINIGGSMQQFTFAFTTGPLLFMFSKKKYRMLMYMANKKDLLEVKEIAETGMIRPVIDKIFPLENITDAYKYYESGQVSGKIIIQIL